MMQRRLGSSRSPRPRWAAVLVSGLLMAVVATSLPFALVDAIAAVEEGGARFEAAAADEGGYRPVTPRRVLDTRTGLSVRGALGDGAIVPVAVAGVGDVPVDGAAAVLVKLIATKVSGSPMVTTWANGTPTPGTVNLSASARPPVTNLAVVPLGSDGAIAVGVRGGTAEVAADVHGWFPVDGDLTPTTPSRILDTRRGLGAPGPIGLAGVELAVAGVGGIPATGALAVALNLTSSRRTAVTVWPAGAFRPEQPTAVIPHGPASALTIVELGEGGKVMLDASVDAQLLGDVQGWFSTDGGYHPLEPAVLVDTHLPAGTKPTVPANAIRDVQVAGAHGVPSEGVTAVALSVWARAGRGLTEVTAWPTGSPRPDAPDVYANDRAVSNIVVVPLGDEGKVSIANGAKAANFVVTAVGWFGPTETDEEPAAAGWRFVPRQLLLKPGETRTAVLTQTDEAGNETHAPLPEGVTFSTTGEGGTITVTPLEGGTVQVTAGDVVESTVVGAQIPGETLAPTLAVTVARLRPEVTTVGDDRVVFPQPDAPAGSDAPLPPEYTEAGVGPFPWSALEARTFLPNTDIEDVDPSAPGGGIDGHLPVVLTGDPPPVGSLLIGHGGSALMGKVIEPDGLPTLVADGYSLITLAVVGLQEIYLDLSYDVETQDLIDIGAIADNGEVALGGDLAAEDADAPTTFSRFAAATADDDNETIDGDGEPVKGGALQKSLECFEQLKQRLGVQLSEFAPAIDLAFKPTLNAFVIIQDGSLDRLRLEAGGGLSLTLQAVLKIQAALTFEVQCKIADLLELEVVAPGPLAPFLSFVGNAEQRFRAQFVVAGGPKVDIGLKCTASAVAVLRVDYIAGQAPTGSAKNDVPTPTCGPVLELPHLNVSSSGIGIKVEATIGAPLVTTGGMRIGGKVAGAVLKLLKRFNSAIDENSTTVKFLYAEIAPQWKVTWENHTQVLSNEEATSFSGAEIVGKVQLETTPYSQLLGKMGIVGEFPFRVPLFQQKFPLFTGYGALNQKEAKYALNGEALKSLNSEETIDFEAGDSIHIQSKLAPKTAGITLDNVELTGATLYKWNGVIYVETDLLSVEVSVPSGADAVLGKVQLDLKATSGADMCAALREATDFAVIGNAPMLLGSVPTPAWGGTFKLRCVEGEMHFNPSSITAASATRLSRVPSFLMSHGQSEDTYAVVHSTVPGWLDVLPATGTLPSSPTQETAKKIEFVIEGRSQSCESQPPEEATVRFTSTKRGDATIVVKRPQVPPSSSEECKPKKKKSGAWGDPHMTSMDGLRYDAQVIGEYVYAQPSDGGDGPTLQVRHELTAPNAPGLAKPTSVTAAALVADGHRIEVYGRPKVDVFIDGEFATLTENVAMAISETLSVVRTGDTVTVHSRDLDLTAVGYGGILDLTVAVADDTPLEGLLGTPNNDVSDDLRVAGTSTTYTVDDVRSHGPALYEVTDSWRLTDLAASLFSRQDVATFFAGNPPFDESSLADERAQVVAALGQINRICAGDAGSGSYVVDALAFELAIGRPLGDLSRYTCSYLVSGRAAVPEPDGGVGGLVVTVDGVGFEPCETTTIPDGRYFCRLVPAFDELEPAPTLPLTATVTGHWPEAPGTVVATGSVGFPSLAPVEGAPLNATATDLEIDPDTLPNLSINGRMTGTDGIPLDGTIPTVLTALDGAGKVVAVFYDDVHPSVLDGAYSITHRLPHASVRADLLVKVTPAQQDWYTESITGLLVGENTHTFDIDHRPPVLHISGTMFGHEGKPLTSPQWIQVRGYRENGGSSFFQDLQVAIDQTTGEFSKIVSLPRDTVRATVNDTASGYSFEWTTVQVSPLVLGPNPVQLDVVYDPAILQVTGSYTRNGERSTDHLFFVIEHYDAAGTLLRYSNQFAWNVDGRYGFVQALPATTRWVKIIANTSPFEDDPSMVVPSVVPGPNPVTFDVVETVRSLALSGNVTIDGQPYTDSFAGGVTFTDADGKNVGGTSVGIVPDASGAYSTSVRMPATAVNASFEVRPPISEDGTPEIVQFAFDGLNTDAETRTQNIDLTSTRVNVTGTLRWLGVPQGGDRTFQVEALDADDESLGSQFIGVQVAEDGTFEFVAKLSSAAAKAIVWSPYLQAEDGRFPANLGFVYDVVSGQETQAPFDLDSVGLGLSGVITHAGEPVANEDVTLIVSPSNDGGFSYEYEMIVSTQWDGSFSLETWFIGWATKVSVRPALGGAPFQRDGLVPGVYDETFDFEIPATREVTITGTVTDMDEPYTGAWQTVDVTVEAYVFGPNNSVEATPWTEAIAPISVDDVWVDEFGRYSLVVEVPSAATLLQAKVRLHDDDGDQYGDVLVVSGTDPVTIPLDVVRDFPLVTLTGTASVECGGGPYVLRLDVWSFATDDETHYDFDTDTWEGGVRHTRTVVPDLATGQWRVKLALPPGTERVGVTNRPSPEAYPHEQVLGAGAFAIDNLGDVWELGGNDVHGQNCPAV